MLDCSVLKKAVSTLSQEMIEKLKAKVAGSRSGINRVDLTQVVEEPLDVGFREHQMQHTTPPPVELDAIGEMIGQRIRQMSMGIHRLDLDEMLDLDGLNIDRTQKVPDSSAKTIPRTMQDKL